MAQLLTLSKAARLVGVRRDTLQHKIREGELSTFEGLLDISELLRVYPKTQVEDSTMLEHVNSIKRKAVSKLVEERKVRAPGIFIRKLDALQEKLFAELENNQNMVKLLRLIDNKLHDSESEINTIESIKEILNEFLHQPAPPELGLHSLLNHLPLEVFTNYARLAKSGHEFALDPNETILEAALRAGLSIPYGCNDGSCGRCKCKVNTGLTRQVRHQTHRLSEEELKHGYILPCTWTSLTDIELDAPIAKSDEDIQTQTIECHIKSIVNQQDLLVVNLKTPASQRLRFLAGQVIEVTTNNKDSASFPIASCPCEQGSLQIHVTIEHNKIHDYFLDRHTSGLAVTIKGPFGNNILDIHSGRSIIFITSHQYFGYIKALIEQSMALEISEHLDLFWVQGQHQNSPFENKFRSWADAIDNFHYHPLQIEYSNDAITFCLQQIESDTEHLPNHDYYCCLDTQDLDIISTFLAGRGVPTAQMHLIVAK